MFEVKEGPRHISKCQMQLLSTTLFADYMQSCTCIRVSNVLFLGIVIAWVFGHCHLIDICIHYIQYKQYIQYIFIYSIHMYLHMHTYIYIYIRHIWPICQYVFIFFFRAEEWCLEQRP